MRRLERREHGQTIVLAALMMTVILGMTGFAVDVARGYVAGRQAQNAADASVQAAANAYAQGGSAQTASDAVSNVNVPAGASKPTVTVSGAVISASVSISTPTTFVRAIPGGPTSLTATKSAQATIRAITQWSTDLVPLGIAQGDLPAAGTVGSIHEGGGGTSSGYNYLQLPYQANGSGTCAAGHGASAITDPLGNPSWVCAVTAGTTTVGQDNGTINSALDAMTTRGAVQNFDYTTITSGSGTGLYVTQPNNPNVIIVPVVNSFGGNAAYNPTIVGYAQFVVTAWCRRGTTCAAGLGPGDIQGVFAGSVNLDASTKCDVPPNGTPTQCATGTWSAGSNLPYEVELTQ